MTQIYRLNLELYHAELPLYHRINEFIKQNEDGLQVHKHNGTIWVLESKDCEMITLFKLMFSEHMQDFGWKLGDEILWWIS